VKLFTGIGASVSLLRNLAPARDRRSIEDPTVPLSSAGILQWIGGDRRGSTSAGVNVTERNAHTHASVWRAINLISGVGGSLDLRAYKTGTFSPAQANLLNNPHPEMTGLEFWRLSFTHRATWGNFYAQKIRNGASAVQYLLPIHPSNVRVAGLVKGRATGRMVKLFEVTLEDGTREPMTTDDIFHVPHWANDGLCGISPVAAARLAIGLGIAAEEYSARLFGSGNLSSGVLQTEGRLEEKDAEALKAKWESKVAGLAKAHGTVIIDSGAKYQQLTMPNKDAQFLESRQFQILEIARFFGVPPFLMYETEKSTSWGTGLEQQALGWLNFDLGPQWLAPLEARVSKELTGAGTEARYDMNRLMRGDSSARGNFYRIMREIGALNADEIRAYESLEPLPDGQGKVYLAPQNMQALSGAASKIGEDVGADANKSGRPDSGPGITVKDQPAKGE